MQGKKPRIPHPLSSRVANRALHSTRQIRDIGFDIALPGTSRSPLKPIRSGRPRRAPQPELEPQRSSRRTPKTTPLVPQPASRRTPSTLQSQRAGSQLPIKLPEVEEREDGRSDSRPTQTDDSGSVTKKRRLVNTYSNLRVQTPTRDVATLVSPTQMEDVREEAAVAGTPSGQEGFTDKVPQAEEQNDRIVPQTSASSIDRSKKKRKKRKSIVQAVRKRVSFAPSDSPLRPNVTSPQNITTAGGGGPYKTLTPTDVVNEPIVSPEAQASEETMPKSKRKKRKSVVQLLKPRKKLAVAPPAVSTSPQIQSIEIINDREELISQPQGQEGEAVQPFDSRLGRVDEEEDQVEEGNHADELEQIEENVAPASHDKNANFSMELKQNGRRSRPRRSSVVSGDLLPGKTGGPKGAPHKAHTVPPSSIAAIKQPQQSRRVKSRAGAIPVTVHRLSRVQEIDDDLDVLAGPAPFPKKAGVNAVDVLGQICRELIDKTINTLQQGADRERNNGSRAEWTRKRKSIEMFGDELDDRLFQMVSPCT